jgi:hypothetical protein
MRRTLNTRRGGGTFDGRGTPLAEVCLRARFELGERETLHPIEAREYAHFDESAYR